MPQNILLILINYLNMKKPGQTKGVNENSRQDVFGFAGHGLPLSASTPPGCIDSESLSWHRGQKTTVKLLNSLWPQPDTMYEEEFSFSLQMLPHLKPGVSLRRQKILSSSSPTALVCFGVPDTRSDYDRTTPSQPCQFALAI